MRMRNITVSNEPLRIASEPHTVLSHVTGFPANFLSCSLTGIIPHVASKATVGFYLIVFLGRYFLLCLCVYGIIIIDVWVILFVVVCTHVWFFTLCQNLCDLHIWRWTEPGHIDSNISKVAFSGCNTKIPQWQVTQL